MDLCDDFFFSVRTSERVLFTLLEYATLIRFDLHTHTHLLLSAKCSCLPSFQMQGLVKVETVSEESE